MSEEAGNRGGVRVLVVPEDGGETRSVRLGRARLRLLIVGAALGLLLLGGMAASWAYLAVRASRAGALAERVAALEEERERIGEIAGRLEEAEERYDRLRDLFGAGAEGEASSSLWLPSGGAAAPAEPSPAGDTGVPSSWPLTERGFVTQPLVPEDEGEHTGVDIAVPSDSYIRAAADGDVVEVDEDPVYGRYVVLEHGGGYRTVYAHASETFVEEGTSVVGRQVLGLTGSTGRSTAPHLHFEILRDGEPVDPLAMVQQP